jgi:transcription initiation factor TFIID subunit 10
MGKDVSEHDKSLLDLLNALDSFNPIIPDALLDYHFTRAGLQCDDVRMKKLVALVAQKFVTDVTNDALAHQRLRQSRTGSTGNSGSSGAKKTVLNMEDLTAALSERGIDVKRPFYHV